MPKEWLCIEYHLMSNLNEVLLPNHESVFNAAPSKMITRLPTLLLSVIYRHTQDVDSPPFMTIKNSDSSMTEQFLTVICCSLSRKSLQKALLIWMPEQLVHSLKKSNN